ncbi:MAG: cyclopropane-fatty-acyl-phospholipid synthase [Geobacteraceae bacterium GWC2_48_7]|nr:MAG: cyclopropane-fatty-acyl-phospholipid synthase [Geobacteraceae bacterium GWC2_48_7]
MKPPKSSTFVVPFHDKYDNIVSSDAVYGFDRWITRKLLQSIGAPPLRIILWNGTEITGAASKPSVGMVIRNRATLWRLLINPLLHFGDDYSAGSIEIQGGLVPFLKTIYLAMEKKSKISINPDSAAYRRNQPNLNALQESRRNIHHHYDIGNDFYKLWLDSDMLYTCAYFPDRDASLEDAQIAKMDLVCRKLRLKPGQTVVEAGCGWGSLARYMASCYGVTVKAYNISHEQIAYARQRAGLEGLEGQVEYIEEDYRKINGTYDRFVSVGMLEHVGPDHYRELGQVINRCLTDQGLGLIHTIGQNRATPMSPWFLQRIFPGSYPPTLREMMAIFEPFDFSVLDVENLRLHYAKTCEHWLWRFEQKLDLISEMFDQTFIRAWRLYLSGCIANFGIGALQLYQVVFSRPTDNLVPWTRSHLFAPTGNPHGKL